MKKILLLLVLLVMAVGVQAQTAAGRTASTKVSDALGLMPARDQAEFGRLMDDLVSTGAEGIDLMTSMFEDTNNVPVSYALSLMYPLRAVKRPARVLPKGLPVRLKRAAIRLYRLIISVCCNGAAVTRACLYWPNTSATGSWAIRRVARCWPSGRPQHGLWCRKRPA